VQRTPALQGLNMYFLYQSDDLRFATLLAMEIGARILVSMVPTV